MMLQEATREEKDAFRSALLDVMRRADSLDAAALKRAAAVTRELQQAVLGRIEMERNRSVYTVDGHARWNPTYLPTLTSAIYDVVNQFGQVYGVQLGEFLPDAWRLGQDMVDVSTEKLGLAVTQPRITPEQVGIAAMWSPDLIQGVTDDVRDVLATRIRTSFLSGEPPERLMKDLRAPLKSQQGVFGAVQYRAERIARTEINGLHAAGNQQRMSQFVREFPEYRMRKRMLVSEVNGYPCRRCSEIAKKGPWDVDDPAAPTLPYDTHPNCRCRMVPDFSGFKPPANAPSTQQRAASVADSTNPQED